MSKRNLFSELNEAVTEAHNYDKGKVTLKTHSIKESAAIDLSPVEILNIREQFNMSRGVFSRYLRTSTRTLENWEQGRCKPNEQAITLLKLIKAHPETLSYIAELY
ncbi:transcriptional regulator [Thalassotalea psychrophila]|uniref:Transcriptional regulator n=1 Tax=Thalassotalea psychrophila TaxID=3065647 RepID=A0ABY9TQT4_9GAMM|nr:transcriptional regulator [Colwelliaceae bacterium SQ149]